jgi:hypothetical protein
MRTGRAIPIVRHGARRTGPARSPRRQRDDEPGAVGRVEAVVSLSPVARARLRDLDCCAVNLVTPPATRLRLPQPAAATPPRRPS